MPKYGHVEWSVPFAKGSYTVFGYDEAGNTVGNKTVATAGAPAALKATVVNQGTAAVPVGMSVYAGCNDFALVQVEVVDANGLVCPDPDNGQSNPITFATSGSPTAWVEGTGNGDPAGLVNNKSPMHPAYHGLALAVIGAGNATGSIAVTATSPGLAAATVDIPVKAVDATVSAKWCWQGAKW
jgi:beta-galactosidase